MTNQKNSSVGKDKKSQELLLEYLILKYMKKSLSIMIKIYNLFEKLNKNDYLYISILF
jgi:hypothetical protein